MELALEGLSKASATAGSDIADIRKATVEALFGLRDHSGALGTYSVTSAGDLTLGNLAVYRIQDGAPKFQRKFTVRP